VNVRVLAVAQRELDDAVVYYNQQQPGLGNAFLAETVAAIDRIRRFPRGWHPLGPELRRCLLRRFPYGVIYRVESERARRDAEFREAMIAEALNACLVGDTRTSKAMQRDLLKRA
jgi:hypothetical protein